jgi:acetolactate synthase I/II/III large subunit
MIKVTDYIVKRLAEYGVDTVFMVTGGGAMHLNDSIGRQFNYICNHHEQACAIAAEGYARASGKLAVVNVTTGPGGLNTLNGVLGQWTDSVPVLYLSGQVKFETTLASCPNIKGLRQLGDQEVDIISIVKPITKFAKMVTDAKDIRRLLEEAIATATTGRLGPVWLDIPMNVQGALVEEAQLEGFDAGTQALKLQAPSATIEAIYQKLANAERPVIIAGHGIRLSGGIEVLESLLKKCNIPVVLTFNGMDLLTDDHDNYIGRFGTLGNRAGNFCVQNADVLLTIGTRNNIRQVSYNWEFFARESYKIVVDIDEAELQKPTVKPDMAIVSDAKELLLSLCETVGDDFIDRHKDWLEWNKVRKAKYPSVLQSYREVSDGIHPYYFMEVLGELMPREAVAVAGDGTACVAPFQAMPMSRPFRIFWNSGCASMGYDLPAAIGAAVAGTSQKIICLAGDGSIQMNIQELQTVVHHNLPIIIFYLNNNGYTSIKQTQDGFFNGHRVGSDAASGVSFPDIIKVAAAYGLATKQLTSSHTLRSELQALLQLRGPIVCEVLLTEQYRFQPRVSSRRLDDGRMVSAPLEDLFPFLDRDEFRNNLFIKEVSQ